jgi:hypothetical protein
MATRRYWYVIYTVLQTLLPWGVCAPYQRLTNNVCFDWAASQPSEPSLGSTAVVDVTIAS